MAAPAQPQQKKTLLMTEGSIWKSILLFSVPLILGNLLQQLYNTADSIIVGNFLGSNALAAVGSSGSPIYLLIGFSQGVAVGAGVVVSQYLGAKDKKETRIAVHTSLAIAVIPRPERSLLEQAVLQQGRADVVQQHRQAGNAFQGRAAEGKARAGKCVVLHFVRPHI